MNVMGQVINRRPSFQPIGDHLNSSGVLEKLLFYFSITLICFPEFSFKLWVSLVSLFVNDILNFTNNREIYLFTKKIDLY